MNYTAFRNTFNEHPVISIGEIKKYFPDFDSRRLVEWQEKGYIQKIRNRMYAFANHSTEEGLYYFTANQLYRPSYVSFESALSFYGFIPEGVFQFTSCTTLKTKTFDTPLGLFSYRHLKPDLYFGYRLEQWQDRFFAIAEPEKVLIDYLYLHSEVRELEDLQALRWNALVIENRISWKIMENYCGFISSPALNKRISILKDWLHA